VLVKEVLVGNCLLRRMMDAREGVRGGDCACEGRDGRGRRYDMTGDAALGR
jgi:hypothetical protein